MLSFFEKMVRSVLQRQNPVTVAVMDEHRYILIELSYHFPIV